MQNLSDIYACKDQILVPIIISIGYNNTFTRKKKALSTVESNLRFYTSIQSGLQYNIHINNYETWNEQNN